MAFIKIEGKPREMKFDTEGNCIAVVDIIVDEASDLPAKNGTITGTPCGTIKVQPGSIAQIIHTGVWATLDSGGKWYDTTGTEVEVEE